MPPSRTRGGKCGLYDCDAVRHGVWGRGHMRQDVHRAGTSHGRSVRQQHALCGQRHMRQLFLPRRLRTVYAVGLPIAGKVEIE